MADSYDDSLMSLTQVGDKKMEDFYEILVVKLLDNPSDVSINIGHRLSLDEHKEISHMETTNRKLATRTLVKYLKRKYGQRWLEVLKKAIPEENKKLKEYLDWEPRLVLEAVKDQKQFEKLMLYYFKVFTQVKIDDVIPYLAQQNMLSMSDMQVLNAIQKTQGDTKATQALLFRLPGTSPDWFRKLVKAMNDNYGPLLEEIDRDLIVDKSAADSSVQVETVARKLINSTNFNASLTSNDLSNHQPQTSNDATVNRDSSSHSDSTTTKESPSSKMSHGHSPSTASVNDTSSNRPSDMDPRYQTSVAPPSYSFSTDSFSSSRPTFDSVIINAMMNIEKLIQEYPAVMQLLTDVPNIQTLMKLQGEHGTDKYTSSVEKLRRETVKIYDQTKRHFFVSCSRHLILYNKALMVYIDCRAKDALDYIKKELKEVGDKISLAGDETDRWLNNLFTDMEKQLNDISAIAPENPGLTRLRSAIMEECEKPSHPSGVVMCRSTEVAAALVKWMKECPRLAGLNPFFLEKASPKEDISRYFRRGYKLIVTPSGAVKAADTSKCGYVLLHDNVSQLRVPDKPTRDADTEVKRDENMYELRCLKCNAFGVSSKDLRTVDKAHHIVWSSSFEDRATFEVHPSPKKYNKWEKKQKIFCKECHEDWGVKAMYKGQTLYCVLTVPSFTIVSPTGEKKHYKDWKEVPFSVAAVDDV